MQTQRKIKFRVSNETFEISYDWLKSNAIGTISDMFSEDKYSIGSLETKVAKNIDMDETIEIPIPYPPILFRNLLNHFIDGPMVAPRDEVVQKDIFKHFCEYFGVCPHELSKNDERIASKIIQTLEYIFKIRFVKKSCCYYDVFDGDRLIFTTTNRKILFPYDPTYKTIPDSFGNTIYIYLHHLIFTKQNDVLLKIDTLAEKRVRFHTYFFNDYRDDRISVVDNKARFLSLISQRFDGRNKQIEEMICTNINEYFNEQDRNFIDDYNLLCP
jgi:hypothetical protein